MPAVVTTRFKLHNAEQFKEALDEPANSVIYLFIGGNKAFLDETNPPSPGTSYANTYYEPWRDMYALKRINSAGASHVTKRYDWTSGTTYKAYDDKSTDVENDEFYVMTAAYNVYKCLYNNAGVANTGGPSTSEPTGKSMTPVQYSDGYIWKYMYSISTGDALKFLTSNYMPVKHLHSDDGSDQWTVQNSAIPGSIDMIRVNSGGTNYLTTPTVTITGDGSGANAIAILSSNSVVRIEVTDRGTGYTKAEVSFTGGSPVVAANATAVISPLYGHGNNAVYELGGKYIMLNARLDGTEGGLFNTTNDFRKIGLVRDPYIYGTNSRSYASECRQTFRYTITGETGAFTQDEVVQSGSNTAVVVEWDSSNKYLYTTLPMYKPFANSAVITGQSSGTSAIISAISTPALKPYSGDIFYLENRIAILRSNDQVEDVKLVLQF